MVVPLLTVLFTGVRRTYDRIGRQLAVDPATDVAVTPGAAVLPLPGGGSLVRAPLVVVVVRVVSITTLSAGMLDLAGTLAGRWWR